MIPKTYGGSALIRRNSISPRVAAAFSLDGSIPLRFAASGERLGSISYRSRGRIS